MKKTAFSFILFFAFLVCLSGWSAMPLSGAFPANAAIAADSSSGDSMCRLVSAYTVTNKHIVQSDLYTWTSMEQIEQLRNGSSLLMKSRSEKYGKSNYDIVLESKKAGGDSIAAMLLDERFAKKRFAWPHPWATVRGYPGENYGDQLLRITFKPQAIFCSVVNATNEKQEYHFYTTNEKEISLAFVKAHPERIAVVYFVDTKKTKKKIGYAGGTYGKSRYRNTTAAFPYREYVICNESMIQSWSYGTQGIISVLKDDVHYLRFLSQFTENKHNEMILSTGVVSYWAGSYEDNCEYENTVALVNSYYDLNSTQLKKTIETLNAAIKAQGKPFNFTAN